MTVSQLYKEIEKRLSAGECDSPAFDACCLLEDLGGLGRGNVPRMNDVVLPDDVCRRLLDAADRRAAGEPLQYLLIDGEFHGASVGHFRNGPYDLNDVVLDIRPEPARREEIIAAIREVNFGHTPQRFMGETLSCAE